MTALDQYIRLEATGRWRPAPDAELREVLVSFGNATLVLSDFNEEALSHWSLAATNTVTKDGAATTYSPDGGTETLTISDPQMNEAIAKVTSDARDTPPPKPQKSLRGPVLTLLALSATILATVFGPDALRGRAFDLIPQARADLLADEIRTHLPPACAIPEGRSALAGLVGAVIPGRHVRVLPWDTPRIARLPDGELLIAAVVVEEAATPEVLAGWLALAASLDHNDGPLRAWVDTIPLEKVVGFLSSARLDDGDVRRMARLLSRSDPVVDDARIAAASATLSARGIADGPFRASLGDAAPKTQGRRLLPDQQWVALQQICAR